MIVVHVDFETRSHLDLTKVGAWRYAQDESTEVLCAAWSVDGGPVESWVQGDSAPVFPIGATFCAHNAQFEIPIWRHCLEAIWGPCPRINLWDCTAARAAYHRLPRGLEKVCEVLGVGVRKDKAGMKLMKRVCDAENEVSDDDIQALVAYCKQDVVCEMAVYKALDPLPPSEMRIFHADCETNARGIAVDFTGCQGMLRAHAASSKASAAAFEKITGVAPTRTAASLDWFRSQGLNLPDLRKQTIDEAISKSSGAVNRALNLRKDASKSSFAKLPAILRYACDDNRLRGLLLYHGAGPGRWTGCGPQFQNLPRNRLGALTGDIVDARKTMPDLLPALYTSDELSQSLRTLLVPGPGKVFVGGDYNAIEPRVLFWLAWDTNALESYHSGRDIYIDLARVIYGTNDISKERRAIGKLGILGCGYRAGWMALQRGAKAQGTTIPDAVAKAVVDSYRKTYKKVVQLWYDLENAALESSYTRDPIKVGRVSFSNDTKFLRIHLPSGRALHYFKPQTVNENGQLKMSYLQEKNRKMLRKTMHGGVWAENIVQAIARDILAHAFVELNKTYMEPVLTIHDEIICEADEPDEQTFENAMLSAPSWAKYIPLAVETWSGLYYGK